MVTRGPPSFCPAYVHTRSIFPKKGYLNFFFFTFSDCALISHENPGPGVRTPVTSYPMVVIIGNLTRRPLARAGLTSPTCDNMTLRHRVMRNFIPGRIAETPTSPCPPPPCQGSLVWWVYIRRYRRPCREKRVPGIPPRGTGGVLFLEYFERGDRCRRDTPLVPRRGRLINRPVYTPPGCLPVVNEA